MIPMSALKDIYTALPNSNITKPVHKNSATANKEPNMISWIRDRTGNDIGAVRWDEGTVTIFESYEYSDEVMQAIGAEKFRDSKQHFTDEDMDKTLEQANEAQQQLEEFLLENSDDSPEQISKLLYSKPNK